MRYEPEEEQNLQIYLTKVAEQLNSLFVDSMIFPVIFGRHDELQGLFTSSLSAASYFRLFEIMCYRRVDSAYGGWDLCPAAGNGL